MLSCHFTSLATFLVCPQLLFRLVAMFGYAVPTCVSLHTTNHSSRLQMATALFAVVLTDLKIDNDNKYNKMDNNCSKWQNNMKGNM